MQRVIIICEGETEREFCMTILAPFFSNHFVHLQSPLIKKTMGGIVKWSVLKKQIVSHLKNEPEAIVTTLIDYYGINKTHNFPNWEKAESSPNKSIRMDILESGMAQSIDESVRNRYIPYIQLHEFEGILFSEIDIFHQQIPREELVGLDELKKTFDEYSNPEMINNNRLTAPSYRLGRIIKGYNKIVYGNILAEAIGLDKIREKCPRFNNWLSKIEAL